MQNFKSLHTTLRKWLPLFVMSLALAIMILDTTILNVTLRNIVHDLNTDLQKIQWVITAYSLTLAAFTITGGRLGDLYGRKKMFVVGAILFALGSLITASSTSVEMMIVGESIIEGIGAALMMPATSSLLRVTYQGRDRQIAFGIWGGIIAGVAAIGPVIGGWISTYYTWRWAFLINVLVVAVLVFLSRYLPESRDENKSPVLDWWGVFLSSLGLFVSVFGIIEASSYGWWTAKKPFEIFGTTLPLGELSIAPVCLALGILILTGFYFWQKHREQTNQTPLVSLDLFRNREFITGSIILSVIVLGESGLTFSIPIFLQAVCGLDPLHTGLAMLPLGFAVFLSAPLSTFLTKKLKQKQIIQIGISLSALGFLILARSLNINADANSLIPGFVLYGIGMGFMMAQISNLTLSAVSAEEAGEASGVNGTIRMIGSSLGMAIFGSIVLGAVTTNFTAGVQNSGQLPDNLKTVLEETAQKQSGALEFGNFTLPHSVNLPPATQTEIVRLVHEATVGANRTSLYVGIIIILASLLLSTKLPNRRRQS